MLKYNYDVEVLPNFFSATFKSVESGEVSVFVIFGERNDQAKLIKFLNREIMLIGFNNISYDGPILVAATSIKSDINERLYRTSKTLIEGSGKNEYVMSLRNPRDVKYKQMDLMRIMAFDKVGVGLKQVAVNLKWHRIQDMPIHHDSLVTPADVDMVLDYNLNDVDITEALYQAIQPQIRLRQEIGQLYGVDVTSASDSKMANVILDHIYTKQTGVDMNELREQRTNRDVVMLKDCVAHNIKFVTEPLIKLLESIKVTTVKASEGFKFGRTISFDGIEYELGIGGLHSKDESGKFASSKDFILRDADVASYYPAIMLNNNIVPAHLGANFTKVLAMLTQERIDAKRSGNKVKADGLKITINSIFGKLGSDTYWLEDAQAMLSVTLSGQLYLLMLIEALHLTGIQTISANTDGIVCMIPVELENKYKEVCTAWQQYTKFELEFCDYEWYIRADVNNYLMKKLPDGKTKEKGRFVREIDLKKGYNAPIVAKAIYNYFVNKVPVERTLRECSDIYEFMISQKAGSDFQMELHVGQHITELQKTNRFFASKGGGNLVKRSKKDGKTTGVLVKQTVSVINVVEETTPFCDYRVDLKYYRKQANDIIEKIETEDLRMEL